MKVKLDENLGSQARDFLISSGFNVETVLSQDLCGSTDRALIDICRNEKRCLVTLDFDFANPVQFPPDRYSGIIVLKLPKDPTSKDIIDCLNTFANSVDRNDLEGKLRIVSKSRIREYSPSK
ncbi:MAG: DUF5615 family PIN-like protein [Patescibacteria group bacterium]